MQAFLYTASIDSNSASILPFFIDPASCMSRHLKNLIQECEQWIFRLPCWVNAGHNKCSCAQQESRGGIWYVSWVGACPNPSKETFFRSDLGGSSGGCERVFKAFRLPRRSGASLVLAPASEFQFCISTDQMHLFESVVHQFTRHRSSQRTQYAYSGLMNQQLLALFSSHFWPFRRLDKGESTAPKPACRLILRPC